MALNKGELAKAIKALMTDMRTRTENADEEFANRLASAIDEYTKGAEIQYNSGLTAPQGPVTGTFDGKLK